MRSCPEWFQSELTRIGGVNPYNDPIFRMVWSPEERMIIGGRWANGFEGYKTVSAIFGTPCWALMVWEPREMNGSPEMWEIETRDSATGYLQFGGYPKHGYYRLMKRFTHRELERREVTEPVWVRGVLKFQKVSKPEIVTYRMEPCGLMLDLMLPMLIRWRRLADAQKVEILREREQEQKDVFLKRSKDARDGNRVRRITPYVQKRAEIIEKGMMAAMKIAAKTGLGMRIGA
jgi:hypothetical protein